MTEQTFGGYDRDTEDAQIRHQPPAAVGNPGKGGSVLDQLKAVFNGHDTTRHTIVKAKARHGATFWLEFNLDIDEDDLREYSQAGKNRAARRKGKGDGDVSLTKSAAHGINAKNTRVWIADPAEAEPMLDEDGDPLTVHSDEWLTALGTEDPIEGLRALFGDFVLREIFDEYLAATGFNSGETELVDPTRASSGD